MRYLAKTVQSNGWDIVDVDDHDYGGSGPITNDSSLEEAHAEWVDYLAEFGAVTVDAKGVIRSECETQDGEGQTVLEVSYWVVKEVEGVGS